MLGSFKVGNRFHDSVVQMKGVLDQLFPVAGGHRIADVDPVAAGFIDFLQLLPHNLHRISLIGAVIAVEGLIMVAHQHQLGGGGAAVDAKVGIPAIPCDVLPRNIGAAVALYKLVVLLLIGKQRLQILGGFGAGCRMFELLSKLLVGVGRLQSSGVDGSAQRHRILRPLGKDCLARCQTQGLLKALLQSLKEKERSAQKQHLAFDFSALAQSGHRLVDHRLEDAGGNVLLARTLVEQRLDVGLGKNSTARCDRVDALVAQAQPVQLLGCHIQQRCHLVDEGAGAAGTAAVHPLLQSAAEEDDLGILSAQLDDRIGVRFILHHRFVGSKYLLYKVDAGILGKSQTCRTGDGYLKRSVQKLLCSLKRIQGRLTHLRQMTLVNPVKDSVAFHNNHLDGGRTNIDSYVFYQSSPLSFLTRQTERTHVRPIPKLPQRLPRLSFLTFLLLHKGLSILCAIHSFLMIIYLFIRAHPF